VTFDLVVLLLPLLFLALFVGYGLGRMHGRHVELLTSASTTKRLSIRVCEKATCWAGKDVHLHAECTTCGGQWTTRMVDPESERKTPVPGASIPPGPEGKRA